MAQGSGSPRQVVGSRQGEVIELAIPLSDGTTARLQVPVAIAQSTATALLQLAQIDDAGRRNLFDEPHLLSIDEPVTGIRRLDNTDVVIAIKGPGLLPIIVRYDAASVRSLSDALSGAISEPPGGHVP
jgi:hypothetical protein